MGALKPLCKVTFDSFYAIQLIESAVVNIAVCYIVSKYTHRYFLFLLIYFFSLKYFIFNCEVMREGFAIAFMLWGMHGYLIGKKWLFFLMFLISLMFHVSACAVLLFRWSISSCPGRHCTSLSHLASSFGWQVTC